jgi:hypothetical protein
MPTLTRFEKLSDMHEAHSRLLKQFREQGAAPALLTEIVQFVTRGCETGKVLDAQKDRDTTQTMLAYWATRLVRAGQDLPDMTLADFDPSLAPEIDDALCPYRGLEAFRDGQHFYGREAAVKELLEKLRAGLKLIAVVGPSGSGKSSVVLGGLLPALAHGALAGIETWRSVTLVPGAQPIPALQAALGIADSNAGNGDAPGVKPLVLVVDQFEEVFTLAKPDDVDPFASQLLALLRAGHIVVLTLRLDYADNMAKLADLYADFEQGRVDLRALSIKELSDAILKPAEDVGLRFEEGIVEDMVAKILGERAGLPLLQFALLKLWEKRSRNRVTKEAYRSVGDPLQALKNCAEDFYAHLMPQEQATMRRTLLKMVKPDGLSTEVTSSRVALEDIYQDNDARERVDDVLNKLEQARLVRRTGGGAQVELAHEALIRNWPTLGKWLDEEREGLRLRFLLKEKAEAWKAKGYDKGSLLRGRELEDAEQSKNLGPLELKFISESRAEIVRLEQEKEEARQRELRQARELAEAKQREMEQAQALLAEQKRSFDQQAINSARMKRLVRISIGQTIVIVIALFGIIFYTLGPSFGVSQDIQNIGMTLFLIPSCFVSPALGILVLILGIRWNIIGNSKQGKIHSQAK